MSSRSGARNALNIYVGIDKNRALAASPVGRHVSASAHARNEAFFEVGGSSDTYLQDDEVPSSDSRRVVRISIAAR